MWYAIGMTFNMILDPEAIAASLAKSKAERTPDRRICTCGHNARSHASQAVDGSPLNDLFKARGVETCTPGRQQCPCQVFEGVATCSDVRLFVFKTSGAFADHALTKGVQAAMTKGLNPQPVGDWTCRSCKRGQVEGVPVGPVPISAQRRELAGPAPYNLLLCSDCVELLRRGTLFA